MIEVVPMEKDKKNKEKFPFPKFLRKYRNHKNFDSLFKKECEKLGRN